MTQRLKIAKIVPSRYPRWPPWQPSWNFSNKISSLTVSRIERKLDGRHHSDTKIQNFFSPLRIAITSLGEERANLSAFRTFVRFVLVWFCRFPLLFGVWEGLRFVIVALPGLFSYLFLLKLLCSDTQDGRHGGHLKILQKTSPPKTCRIEPKLDGRHHSDTEIQNGENRSSLRPWQPSWNSSNDISSQTVSPIEPKLDRRHHSDTEIQNC